MRSKTAAAFSGGAYLRWRNDECLLRGYIDFMMSTQLLARTTTVQQILQDRPETGRVFIENHTACVGCRLARFCTLEEVAGVYGLDLELFLAGLKLHLSPSNTQGVEHEIH